MPNRDSKWPVFEKRAQLKLAFIYKLSVKEPLGIAYLSSYIKTHISNVMIKFFDPKVDNLDAIKSFSPNIILYSCMSGQVRENVFRNLYLKKVLSPFMSVFGGPHPTYFPEMIEEDGVDIICRGEGERSLGNLINAIQNGIDIYDIKGLWIKNGGVIYKNEIDVLIENLDDIPFPDRNLFYEKSPIFRGSIAKSVFTARGCPFRCTYCYNSSLNMLVKGKGKSPRFRSPSSVVKEVTQLKNQYPLPYILFGDDVFAGVNIEWLGEFADLYSSLNIPYNISIRAEFVKPEIVKYLKKSGCASATLAIEHGDYAYRKKYLDRHMSNERLVESVYLLESAGIRVATPTMIGLPHTSFDDDIKTLELVCKAKPTFAGTTIFQPYPGLPLTELCLNKKLIGESFANQLNTDCYQPAHIKGIDYSRVSKLRRIFGILRVAGYRYPDALKTLYKIIPDNFFIYHLNNFINYIFFYRYYDYKRGVLSKAKEVFVGLDTGAFGVHLKWLGRSEKF
ncbi:MAG: B12-binding domain-containing radical SAM protein [Magnetococcales bacterium]|nr:B12-binding domain-containing radical SAM protein [Magnetococcales bacterium]MBF0321678.1 B12-binding domain-containing radical SAM protein [Magnetococcales bacterium]